MILTTMTNYHNTLAQKNTEAIISIFRVVVKVKMMTNILILGRKRQEIYTFAGSESRLSMRNSRTLLL